MAPEKKEAFISGFWKYVRAFFAPTNITQLVILTAFSFKLLYSLGDMVYINGKYFIRSVDSAKMMSSQAMRDLSEFKIRQHIVDSGQNHKIDRLIAKQP